MYKFVPIVRPMIWGRELWVLSGYPERESVVENGPCKGLRLGELLASDGAALLGAGVYERFGGEFPLLVKFIDAKSDLSIQVHPGEEMASRLHSGHGKTEMWYVIGAEERSHLYAGLSRNITPDEYEHLVQENRITEVLADHKTASGDVFFLPAGRIHAICGGTYLAEIQQTSDITYRIWDYGRKGVDGKPRELHTELAKQAIDYAVYPSYRTEYQRIVNSEIPVVNCEFFSTSVYRLNSSLEKDLRNLGSFLVVICVGGSGSVKCESESLSLKEGECLLVPATAQGVTFIPDRIGGQGEARFDLLTSCVG